MLNFAVDPAVVQPFVPRGTELDFHNGETFVSVVGFLFLDTRVLGFPIPHHRNFEEVNLRFYVRRQGPEGWRRGVVFVRELVPRRAIATVARVLYGEPYLTLPMRHAIDAKPAELSVSYEWRFGKTWETLALTALGPMQDLAPGSHEEFIVEHYWGYTARPRGTSEYRVEHPPWRLQRADNWRFDANVTRIYGAQFVETLAAPPASAFIAEGSRIEVLAGNRATNSTLSF